MIKLSIRSKAHLAITGLVLVICAATVYIFYCNARQALFDEVRERLASLANSIALQVNAQDHESLHTRKDESTEAYRHIKARLKRMKAANPGIRYVYTMRPGDSPMSWHFVVDAESEDPSHVGDDYDVSEFPELRCGLSKPSADTEITADKWGVWVSGYAPIRDKSGRAVGIVGVDMSVRQLMTEMADMRRMGILCVLAATLLSISLGTVLASLIVRPIKEFIVSLQAATHGDLQTLVGDKRNDEVGQVARTFNELLRTLRHKDEMLSQMSTDYLTGLPNHRYFQQRLHEEIIGAEERSGDVALLMLDIDKFKPINDSLGHDVGDSILKEIGKLLLLSLHEQHVVARYGAEEFAIILPGMGAAEAVDLAEAIRRQTADHEFRVPAERMPTVPRHPGPIPVTVSIGVAVYPSHSREKDGLIMAADIALYRAKHLGRNMVCSYDAEVNSGSTDPYHVYTFIQDPSRSAIEALAAAVDARDPYTRNHSENVSKYTRMIGEQLGLPDSEMELLHVASLLHDVGKIGVPDYVLNKPAGLDDEEMDLIRAHPAVGESIVRNSRNLDAILPGILYHHERFNGTGCPYGLSYDDIPLIARIISVADAFDALTTDRPHRRALSFDEAINLLRESRGAQFDPVLVDAFLARISEAESSPQDLAA